MKRKRFVLSFVCLCNILGLTNAQFGFEQEEEEYKGRFIGSFNSYHHQVSGDVYSIDEHKILIKNFVYDGNGKDTFFWAGGSNRPDAQGFIVPNEDGRTNVLKRYLNDEITLRLPDQKVITDIKWFAVYDLTIHDAFGDLYIPEEFEAPGEQVLTDLQGRSNDVNAKQVIVMNSKVIKLQSFSYDGRGGDVYFWVGVGPQPSSKGHKVPDDMGYLSPLRAYSEEDVYLQLPGELTVFEIRWFSVFDLKNKRDLGHLIVPEDLNVPPALIDVVPRTGSLPNCEMLHNNLMVSWSVFAPSITIQVSALIAENEYVALGVSEQGASRMVGSDAAVMYINGYLAHADDYNITAHSPCTQVLGVKRGVCLDNQVGGIDNNQIQEHKREDGVTSITYRRELKPTADHGDKAIKEDGPTSIVWAIGRLAGSGRNLEPSFHHIYPKTHVTIDFSRKQEENNCIPFTKTRMTGAMSQKDDGMVMNKKPKSWKPVRIFDPTRRKFDARLGPSGGMRGYSGITGNPSIGLAWYIEGYLAPELYLRRGLTYTFRVEGGNDPYSPEYYHPLVITTSPDGGFNRLSPDRKRKTKILAGVEYTRRGVPRTTASGRLCLWKHRQGVDRRLDDKFDNFNKYRNSQLELKCDDGDFGILEVTPNSSWPDVVYYQSYTHPYMGWRINVVDSFNTRFIHQTIHDGASAITMGTLTIAASIILSVLLAN